MDNHDLRNAIYERLDSLRPGTLSFWGNWFGRPYDNIHRIVGAYSLEETTIIYFDQAETLLIDEPRDWSLEGGLLLVRHASRVRFQWFYFGRLPDRETLQFEEYRWTETNLSFDTDAQPGRRPQLARDAPAVQLHVL